MFTTPAISDGLPLIVAFSPTAAGLHAAATPFVALVVVPAGGAPSPAGTSGGASRLVGRQAGRSSAPTSSWIWAISSSPRRSARARRRRCSASARVSTSMAMSDMA